MGKAIKDLNAEELREHLNKKITKMEADLAFVEQACRVSKTDRDKKSYSDGPFYYFKNGKITQFLTSQKESNDPGVEIKGEMQSFFEKEYAPLHEELTQARKTAEGLANAHFNKTLEGNPDEATQKNGRHWLNSQAVEEGLKARLEAEGVTNTRVLSTQSITGNQIFSTSNAKNGFHELGALDLTKLKVKDQIAIPINLGGGHWTGVLITKTDDGKYKVDYVEPFSTPKEELEKSIKEELEKYLGADIEFKAHHGKQSDGVSCGPLSVEMLARLATGKGKTVSGEIDPKIARESINSALLTEAKATAEELNQGTEKSIKDLAVKAVQQTLLSSLRRSNQELHDDKKLKDLYGTLSESSDPKAAVGGAHKLKAHPVDSDIYSQILALIPEEKGGTAKDSELYKKMFPTEEGVKENAQFEAIGEAILNYINQQAAAYPKATKPELSALKTFAKQYRTEASAQTKRQILLNSLMLNRVLKTEGKTNKSLIEADLEGLYKALTGKEEFKEADEGHKATSDDAAIRTAILALANKKALYEKMFPTGESAQENKQLEAAGERVLEYIKQQVASTEGLTELEKFATDARARRVGDGKTKEVTSFALEEQGTLQVLFATATEKLNALNETTKPTREQVLEAISNAAASAWEKTPSAGEATTIAKEKAETFKTFLTNLFSAEAGTLDSAELNPDQTALLNQILAAANKTLAKVSELKTGEELDQSALEALLKDELAEIKSAIEKNSGTLDILVATINSLAEAPKPQAPIKKRQIPEAKNTKVYSFQENFNKLRDQEGNANDRIQQYNNELDALNKELQELQKLGKEALEEKSGEISLITARIGIKTTQLTEAGKNVQSIRDLITASIAKEVSPVPQNHGGAPGAPGAPGGDGKSTNSKEDKDKEATTALTTKSPLTGEDLHKQLTNISNPIEFDVRGSTWADKYAANQWNRVLAEDRKETVLGNKYRWGGAIVMATGFALAGSPLGPVGIGAGFAVGFTVGFASSGHTTSSAARQTGKVVDKFFQSHDLKAAIQITQKLEGEIRPGWRKWRQFSPRALWHTYRDTTVDHIRLLLKKDMNFNKMDFSGSTYGGMDLTKLSKQERTLELKRAKAKTKASLATFLRDNSDAIKSIADGLVGDDSKISKTNRAVDHLTALWYQANFPENGELTLPLSKPTKKTGKLIRPFSSKNVGVVATEAYNLVRANKIATSLLGTPHPDGSVEAIYSLQKKYGFHTPFNSSGRFANEAAFENFLDSDETKNELPGLNTAGKMKDALEIAMVAWISQDEGRKVGGIKIERNEDGTVKSINFDDNDKTISDKGIEKVNNILARHKKKKEGKEEGKEKDKTPTRANQNDGKDEDLRGGEGPEEPKPLLPLNDSTKELITEIVAASSLEDDETSTKTAKEKLLKAALEKIAEKGPEKAEENIKEATGYKKEDGKDAVVNNDLINEIIENEKIIEPEVPKQQKKKLEKNELGEDELGDKSKGSAHKATKFKPAKTTRALEKQIATFAKNEGIIESRDARTLATTITKELRDRSLDSALVHLGWDSKSGKFNNSKVRELLGGEKDGEVPIKAVEINIKTKNILEHAPKSRDFTAFALYRKARMRQYKAIVATATDLTDEEIGDNHEGVLLLIKLLENNRINFRSSKRIDKMLQTMLDNVKETKGNDGGWDLNYKTRMQHFNTTYGGASGEAIAKIGDKSRGDFAECFFKACNTNNMHNSRTSEEIAQIANVFPYTIGSIFKSMAYGAKRNGFSKTGKSLNNTAIVTNMLVDTALFPVSGIKLLSIKAYESGIGLPSMPDMSNWRVVSLGRWMGSQLPSLPSLPSLPPMGRVITLGIPRGISKTFYKSRQLATDIMNSHRDISVDSNDFYRHKSTEDKENITEIADHLKKMGYNLDAVRYLLGYDPETGKFYNADVIPDGDSMKIDNLEGPEGKLAKALSKANPPLAALSYRLFDTLKLPELLEKCTKKLSDFEKAIVAQNIWDGYDKGKHSTDPQAYLTTRLTALGLNGKVKKSLDLTRVAATQVLDAMLAERVGDNFIKSEEYIKKVTEIETVIKATERNGEKIPPQQFLSETRKELKLRKDGLEQGASFTLDTMLNGEDSILSKVKNGNTTSAKVADAYDKFIEIIGKLPYDKEDKWQGEKVRQALRKAIENSTEPFDAKATIADTSLENDIVKKLIAKSIWKQLGSAQNDPKLFTDLDIWDAEDFYENYKDSIVLDGKGGFMITIDGQPLPGNKTKKIAKEIKSYIKESESFRVADNGRPPLSQALREAANAESLQATTQEENKIILTAKLFNHFFPNKCRMGAAAKDSETLNGWDFVNNGPEATDDFPYLQWLGAIDQIVQRDIVSTGTVNVLLGSNFQFDTDILADIKDAESEGLGNVSEKEPTTDQIQIISGKLGVNGGKLNDIATNHLKKNLAPAALQKEI